MVYHLGMDKRWIVQTSKDNYETHYADWVEVGAGTLALYEEDIQCGEIVRSLLIAWAPGQWLSVVRDYDD